MTNFEKVKENLTIDKMAFLMFNVPQYCPFKYGCDECGYCDENKTGYCCNEENWTEQNYKEWLESEVEEIEAENTKEKAYKNAFNMLVSELGLDYYDDNDLIKIKYIKHAMLHILKSEVVEK